jgi:hypothetical protein
VRGTLFNLLILLLLACVPCGAGTPTMPSVNTVNGVRIGNESRAQAQIPVATLSDLDAVRNDLAGSYVLVADIDASPTAALDYNAGLGWQPIGTQAAPFTGTFDGDGYTITGLTIRRPNEDNVGLFGVLGVGSEVRDLSLDGASILGHVFVGVLAAQASATITNCHSSGSVSGGYVGGLVGVSRGTIVSSSSACDPVSGYYAGGLVGDQKAGEILNSSASGNVGTGGYVGGLVGEASASISGCSASGNVTSLVGYCSGGLLGWANYTSEISDCVAGGNVTGGEGVGGLVGFQYEADVIRCSASGKVSGEYSVGGLVGLKYTDCVLTDSSATGCVEYIGNHWDCENFGGLVGTGSGLIARSFARGTVKGGYRHTGGLVGNHSGDLLDCHATGDVSGTYFVGGLIGSGGWHVHSSYASGSVCGARNFVGGLTGMAAGDIHDSYALGDISGKEAIGGLLGDWTGNPGYSVGHCYAGGRLQGTGLLGGLAGFVYPVGSISSSYWNVETSGQATSDGGEGAMGRTTDEMTFPFGGNTYRGWDFVTVWDSGDANNGYPFHRWQTTRYTLHYTAGAHGVLTGPTTQSRIPGATGAPVTAIGFSGYRFDRWSDGSRQNPRADRNVTDDLTVQAEFVETTDAWQLY